MKYTLVINRQTDILFVGHGTLKKPRISYTQILMYLNRN